MVEFLKNFFGVLAFIIILYYVIKHFFTIPDIKFLLDLKDYKKLHRTLFYKMKQSDAAVNYVRSDSAVALGQIGNPASIDPLLLALRDNDVRVVQTAAQAIGQIIYLNARQPIFEAYQRQDQVKLQAGLALLAQMQIKITGALIQAFNPSTPQETIIYTLGTIAEPQATSFFTEGSSRAN